MDRHAGDQAHEDPRESNSLAEPRCPTRTRHYRRGELLAEGFPAEEIGARLHGDDASVVWLDLVTPNRLDLQIVTDLLGCHPLAVDDAISSGRRASAYRFQDHMYANIYVLGQREPDGRAHVGEMSIFITPRALITVRKDDFEIETVIENWHANARLVKLGSETSVLAYGLFDAVADGHLEAARALEEATDGLEKDMLERAGDDRIRRRSYDLNVQLADLRQVVGPTREILARFVRNDAELVDEALVPYFHDVLISARGTYESIEMNRERVDRIVQNQLSEHTAQLNETTRKLAAWAAIIGVPSVVTGFYGQNVPFPGADRLSGFVTSTVIMLGLAVGLYWLLRRNRWL